MKNIIYFYKNLGENFKLVYLPAHLSVLTGLFLLYYTDSSLHWLWLIYPSWFLFGHIGFGIFLHKYYCHKSFETYTWLARIGGYLGMLAGTGSPVMLKALHIGQHHPNSDSEKDPHTPLKGFLWAYFLWLNHKWDFKKLWIVKDIMKDPIIKFFHQNYYKIYWGTWLLLLAIDWRLAIFTISTSTVIEFHLSGIVNTLGHMKHKGSYQNYPDCGDNSQNITWLNWITLGLGLHNNHHGEPWNYNYARRKGEFDFSSWFIPLISIKKKNENE